MLSGMPLLGACLRQATGWMLLGVKELYTCVINDQQQCTC
jgi:hypothetical protein